MDKLDMQSKNLVDENISKIAELFPNCITEGKNEEGQVVKLVDFDLLKQELSKEIVEGNDERYTLNWAGKKQAILIANSPINATLRPCREESVDFDNTKNLYIEGDNLDVLKLLRETYLGKVKMIYIDPPYNTGNDFVYEDDFATSTEDYLQASKSYDEQGNCMFQNNESNGRFHSDWLSMMYSRLKIAKDLLADDGAIFISIDEHEYANLKSLADNIFGSRNFVETFIWNCTFRPSNFTRTTRKNIEYVICYSKQPIELQGKYEDTQGEFSLTKKKHNPQVLTCPANYVSANMKDGIYNKGNYDSGYELLNDIIVEDGKIKNAFSIRVAQSIWSQAYLEEEIKKGVDLIIKSDKTMALYARKSYQQSELKPTTLLPREEIGDVLEANGTLARLIGSEIFDYPKPTTLVQHLFKMIKKSKDSIVLDFFSGSSTTAHAVMQLNAEDGGNRQFIMVQLPEKCDEKSEAYKAGYKNICEIGKERIRRAGNKIKDFLKESGYNHKKVMTEGKQFEFTDEDGQTVKGKITGLYDTPKNIEQLNNEIAEKLDVGFRVLKLDSSNMKDIYYRPAELNQATLMDYVSNIKEDRTPEDLLFQVMLDMGVMLSSEIKTIEIKGKKVFNVNDGNLVCCFDNDLTDEVVTEIAKMQPLYAVFRDSSMSSDSVAVNFDQIFETYSPTTRKVL